MYVRDTDLIVLMYKTGNPDPETYYVNSIESGKIYCDTFITWKEVVRAELCDTQEGQVLYGRGYRENPASPVFARGDY